ncbi:hypothetical protein M3Y96_00968800 [Aphelenchoides besseyi]|nr:hypothetical protein M3Y96_00968800 [Aphelenchoides besseyi]
MFKVFTLLVIIAVLNVEAERPRACHLHSFKRPNGTVQLITRTETRNETISFGEQVYRLIFKRSNKKTEEKDEAKSNTTTTAAPKDHSDEPKHSKHHHKGHKKHKKHHHHQKDNNGTDLDWHSIG